MVWARFVAVGLIFVLSTLVLADNNKGKNKGNKKKANDRGRDQKQDAGGTIWHYKMTREGKSMSGNFRVHQFQIFNGNDKVGVVRPIDNDETSFRVTDFPELNGVATIQKVRDMPGHAMGTLTKPNGDKWDIEIEFKERR
jgi:hypothetical protein